MRTLASVMLALAVSLECDAAVAPLFDTAVRAGSPLFARVRFSTPISANQGLIRLPNQSEVMSIGGKWWELHDSLELLPSASKLGVYYLNSRVPLDQNSFEVYLAHESAESLEIFVFEVSLVDGATRINTRTRQSQLGLTNSVTNSPIIALRSDPIPPQRSRALVLPAEQPTEVVGESKKSTPADIELNDDLSEKLRALIEAQASTYREIPSKSSDKAMDADENYVTDSRAASVASSIQTSSRVGSEIEIKADTDASASSTPQPSTGQPIATEKPPLEAPPLTVNTSNGIFDTQLSIAELFFIALVCWLAYFTRLVFGLRERLRGKTKRGDSDNDNGSNRHDEFTSSVDLRTKSSNERAQGTRDEPEASTSRSALADVLRTAAKQAEYSEGLNFKAQVDSRMSALAAAQQQALLECAARLQGFTPVTESPVGVAVSGEMPARPPVQGLNPMSEQLSDTAAESPGSGSASSSTDERRTARRDRRQGPPGGVNPQAPGVPNEPPKRQGPRPITPASSPVSNKVTPPATSEDYSEQISLAVVYFNMGEVDTARDLLNGVIKEGSAQEQAKARKFIEENFDD